MKKLSIAVVILVLTSFAIGCGGDTKKGDTKLAIEHQADDNSETKQVEASIPDELALSPEQKLGKRLFIMCEACHNVKLGEPHKVGPNLHGVFGRKAGSLADFKYSEAVLGSDITWSDETIREWLVNPNDYIKGTNMVFVGLPKKRQQDALLSYLHRVAE